MPTRRSTAVILLMLLVPAACRIERTPRAGLADPTGVARAEIDARLRGYQSALIDNDARRAAAFFAPQAQLYLPDTPDILGRGAIDAALAADFAGAGLVDFDVSSDDIDVAVNVAHQFGSFRQRRRGDNGSEQVVAGRFAIRWLRAAESTWYIERMLVNHSTVDSAAVTLR